MLLVGRGIVPRLSFLHPLGFHGFLNFLYPSLSFSFPLSFSFSSFFLLFLFCHGHLAAFSGFCLFLPCALYTPFGMLPFSVSSGSLFFSSAWVLCRGLQTVNYCKRCNGKLESILNILETVGKLGQKCVSKRLKFKRLETFPNCT